jgi:acetolactate synthase-1/2/3 large subunit
MRNVPSPLGPKVRGGTLVARTLSEKGIDIVFTLAGGFINPVLEGLQQYGIRVVNAPHEQIAGHLADGTARLTRRPSVCLVGPEGFGNALPAMLEALGARSPVVFITGSSTLKRRGQGGFKEIDHVRIAEGLTKASLQVSDGNRIGDFIDKAFELAMNGNPGPVHLTIPTDLLYSSFPEMSARDERPFAHKALAERLAWPDPAGVAHLAELLRHANRPVIVAGSGVWWGEAEQQLADFATAYAIPVLIVPYHQHLFATDCPAYCGLADVHQFPPAEFMLQHSDLVITFGCRLDNMLNFGSPPLIPEASTLVCVDGSSDDAAANHAADWRLLGHPRAVLMQLKELADALSWPPATSWLAQNRAERGRWVEGLKDLVASEADQQPMHPLCASMAVLDQLRPEDFLVIDGGDTHYWAEMALNVAAYEGKTLRGVFHPGPFSLLGCGIGFGLAIKLKNPTSNVVVLCGDGAFLCSGLSIETAFHEKAPITVVVDNNRGLGSIAQQQIRVWESGTPYGTQFRDIPFDRLFEGMGGHGETVDAASAIGGAIDRAMESDMPACVNVRSRSVISPLVAALTDRRAKASIE